MYNNISVKVLNLPSNQTVSGALAINNFPATQNVSGSISISNLPPVQTVNGNVNIANLPAIQTVSGAISVSNLPAVQTVNVNNFPISQTVNGSIYVSNFPNTQAISAIALPLPNGAARDGADISGALMPIGGVGIRGWLSNISSLLSGNINVTVTNPNATGSGNSSDVRVINFPTTQTLTVSNFPTTQAVTVAALPLPNGAATSANQPTLHADGGALAHIINFPFNQTINGSVSVNNFPLSQAITAASLPLPNGAAADGVDVAGVTLPSGSGIRGWLSALYNQVTTANTNVSIVNFPTTQTVTGTITISNFPTTQAITVATLPLPNGAAADGTDITGATMPAGGVGIRGWLSNVSKLLSNQLTDPIGSTPTNTPIAISGVDALGHKQYLRVDTFGSPSDTAWVNGSGSLIALLKANIAATNKLIGLQSPPQGIAAMSVDTAYPAGRKLQIICTQPGSVNFTFVDGSTQNISVGLGKYIIDGAITQINSANTTAAATYASIK